MNTIVEKITELIKEMLQGWVMSNLEGMFTDVNTKVGTIAGEVSQTPSAWNAGIFNMIKNLSDTVIIPIAGIIITYQALKKSTVGCSENKDRRAEKSGSCRI